VSIVLHTLNYSTQTARFQPTNRQFSGSISESTSILIFQQSKTAVVFAQRQVPGLENIMIDHDELDVDELVAGAEDVCKALRYQAKMPAFGYCTVLVGWGKKTQRSAKFSYLSHYRLFSALQQYDLLDFWLAGGEGAQIIREARRKLDEHRERKRGRGSETRPRYRPGTTCGESRLRAF
jgi:hypothetical protein